MHVCNLHYTKESLGLYHSTFPSNMIISHKCINH
nr:MAG TPA: Initiation control protein YabA [Caudoviricetes sp.]